MTRTTIQDVAACVDLKRTPAGLEINTVRGNAGCVDAAFTVAQYFLTELGISPGMARILEGEEAANVVIPDLSLWGDEARILAIEEYVIFPVTPPLRGWSVVHPMWIELPMDVYSNNSGAADTSEGRMVPAYSIESYSYQKEVTFPLFETVLLGIQTCLSDRLNLEMRSLYGLYLELEGRSTEVNQEKLLEREYLAKPAMYLLNRILPVLSPKGYDVKVCEGFRNGYLISGESVHFEYDMLSSTWSVHYRNGKKWQPLNINAAGESPALNMMIRRDFRTVFMIAAAAILEQKLHEIQKEIYTYKLKAA